MDFFVDFGDEPPHGRFPLRQAWRLLSGGLTSLAPLVLRNAEGNRSRFAIIRQGKAGEILALNERALGEGCSAVRRSHWGEVGFSEPEIRTFLDSRGRNALEPIMRVKVNALREHLEAVTTVLGARGVRVREVQRQGRFVCLQSEARLASLLGLENQIRSLSSGSAEVACWLDRYQPAAAPRGTEAARMARYVQVGTASGRQAAELPSPVDPSSSRTREGRRHEPVTDLAPARSSS